jgi:RNA polymerase sporulation-specific sigma factor
MFSTLIQLAFQNLIYFALHLERNGAFPKQLSKEEELECIKKMSHGDYNARNRLIEHNLRLVAFIVKKQYPESKEQEDLISIGIIGLIRAAETFIPDKKINFSTYASKCIDKQILSLGMHICILF